MSSLRLLLRIHPWSVAVIALAFCACAEPERKFLTPDHPKTAIATLEPGGIARAVPRRVTDGELTRHEAESEREVYSIVPSANGAHSRSEAGELISPADYAAQNSDALPTPSVGVIVQPSPAAGKRAGLILDVDDWKADRIDTLRVSVIAPHSTRFQLAFRGETMAPTEDGFPHTNRLVATDDRGRLEQREITFDVTAHPNWRGALRGLRLDVLNGSPIYWVGRMQAFMGELGAEDSSAASPLAPLALELEGGIGRRELRRVFPAEIRGDQVFVVESSVAAQMKIAYALPQRKGRVDGEVRFEVALGTPRIPWLIGEVPNGDWLSAPTVAFAADLQPEVDHGYWREAEVELPAGQTVVWLRTSGGREEFDFRDRSAIRVNGLWGQPRIRAKEDERPISVLLISADTLRADRLGAYGQEGARTPAIDSLASEGTLFRDCFAAANATSPSHASLMTGLFPKDHTVEDNQSMLPDSFTTLAELNQNRVCIGSTAARHLNAGLSGLGQGMDIYYDTPPDRYGTPDGKILTRPGDRSGVEVNAQLIDGLHGLGEDPFFAWVHYFDPHTPYDPAAEFAPPTAPDKAAAIGTDPFLAKLLDARIEADPDFGLARVQSDGENATQLPREDAKRKLLASYRMLQFIDEKMSAAEVEQLYQAEIAELDARIGELVHALRELGRLEDTLIVFTSDHGEALGEHDIWFSHRGIFDNTLHIPLIMRGPGVPAGGVVSAPVSGVDIYPTLCDLANVALAGPGRGRSLVPLLNGFGGPTAPRRWFEHTNGFSVGFRTPERHAILALTTHERGMLGEIVERDTLEIYAVEGDELVLLELAPDAPEVLETRALIEEWLRDRAAPGSAQAAPITPEDRALLEALGYTDSSDG